MLAILASGASPGPDRFSNPRPRAGFGGEIRKARAQRGGSASVSLRSEATEPFGCHPCTRVACGEPDGRSQVGKATDAIGKGSTASRCPWSLGAKDISQWVHASPQGVGVAVASIGRNAGVNRAVLETRAQH